MLLLDRWKTFSYINCLKEHFNDYKLFSSMAFLIASPKGDNLEVFSPDIDGVVYVERLEDVKGECDSYVNLFSTHDATIIKNASKKLWYYYVNKPVEFTAEKNSFYPD